MISELQQRDMQRLSNGESQKLSRECLENALFRLMGEKDYEKISISEIVELAGVSRNALYRNYGTKEALLDSLTQSIFRKLEESMPAYEDADAASFEGFFRKVAQHADSFRILLIVRYPLAGRLREDTEPNYRKTAWLGAFSNIVLHWFQQGMKETPARMGMLCGHLLAKLRQDEEETEAQETEKGENMT